MSVEYVALLIDEKFHPFLNNDEVEKMSLLQKMFIESYIANKDELSLDEWLISELKINFPQKSCFEIETDAKRIILSLNTLKENQESLNEESKRGMSKEHWFFKRLKKVVSNMHTKDGFKFLGRIFKSISKTNNNIYNTILNNNSSELGLNEFMAERYHVQAFNSTAIKNRSVYRAHVIYPVSGDYVNTSAFIAIKTVNGEMVKLYKPLYSRATKEIKNLNWNPQHYIFNGKSILFTDVSDTINSPDNITSTQIPDVSYAILRDGIISLTSEGENNSDFRFINEVVQSGFDTIENDIDEVSASVEEVFDYVGTEPIFEKIPVEKTYEVEENIERVSEKQASLATLSSSLYDSDAYYDKFTFPTITKEVNEFVENSLDTDDDFGLKVASAGALKVAIEKKYVHTMSPDTDIIAVTAIVHMSYEHTKIYKKISDGKITANEGVGQLGKSTISTLASTISSVARDKGALAVDAIGSILGITFGQVGIAVSSLVCATIGHFAGTKIGERVVDGAKKVKNVANNVFKTMKDTAEFGINKVKTGLKQFSKIFS